MAGGITILLIVVVLGVAAVVAFLLMSTGGAVEARRGGPHDDRLDREGGERPRHTRPSDPATENTTFVGTGAGHRDRRGGRDDGPQS